MDGGDGEAMRVSGDKYYGSEAETYDAQRKNSQRWLNEMVAVTDLVTAGPVLDVPLGTGRFIPAYRARGLDFTGLDISSDMLAVTERTHGYKGLIGSVLQLPFPDQSFATAVCIRLLDWLDPEEMETAIAELRRVATCLVLTIRHGTEGISINYTHDLARFYLAINGLFIAERRTMEKGRHGHEEIFSLRPAIWQDALDQFRWHDGEPHAEMERIAGMGIDRGRATITAEHWTHSRIRQVLAKNGGLPREYSRHPKPRFAGAAAVVLIAGGKSIILDGIRRFNVWQHKPGRYPVLVIRL